MVTARKNQSSELTTENPEQIQLKTKRKIQQVMEIIYMRNTCQQGPVFNRDLKVNTDSAEQMF